MNKQQISKNQKSVLTVVAILSVVSVAGLALVASVASTKTRLGPTAASVVNLRGETTCLNNKQAKEDSEQKKKSNQCIQALKVSNGVKYVLVNAKSNNRFNIPEGNEIMVTGTLSPPVEDNRYENAGVIAVDEIEFQTK